MTEREIELPPLPKPFGVTSFVGLDEIVDVDAYGRDQMIGFARAAVLADRAARAALGPTSAGDSSSPSRAAPRE